MMRIHRPLLILLLFVSISTAACGQALVRESDLHDYNIVTITGGLENPWGMAFLPSGDLLVTERPGRMRIIRDGMLLDEEVPGVPEVYARGQGGLLDVALHPDFETNQSVYFTYSKPLDDGSTTALARGRFENDALTDVEDLFIADSEGRGHYGSRIVFDGEGHVFITVGDRQARPSGDLEAHPAQDLSKHQGVVIRLNDDGSVPADNPFVGRDGARPETWSYGHRNQQGMAFHPGTGDLWAVEHGPQGGDELNLIEPGLNYGWPVIGYGVNYGSGTPIHESSQREGMEQPRHYWVPSIATSGLMIYTGDRFPGWKGSAFVGGMAGVQLARLTLEGQRVTGEETLVQGVGRIRDVRQGPDDLIYLLIDADGGPMSVLRLEPAVAD